MASFEDSGMDISNGNGSFIGSFEDGIISLFHTLLFINNSKDEYEERRQKVMREVKDPLERSNELARLRALRETRQI